MLGLSDRCSTSDRVAALAERLGLPRAVLDGGDDLPAAAPPAGIVRTQPFEAVVAVAYPNAVLAKLAIADLLGMPLARLPESQRAWIDALLRETLDRTTVLTRARDHFRAAGGHAC